MSASTGAAALPKEDAAEQVETSSARAYRRGRGHLYWESELTEAYRTGGTIKSLCGIAKTFRRDPKVADEIEKSPRGDDPTDCVTCADVGAGKMWARL